MGYRQTLPWKMGTWGSFVSAGGISLAPTAPSDCAASQTQKDTNTVTWTDNSSNETGFEVEVNINGGGFNNITTTAAGVTSYDHTTITVGSSYVYRVRAVNGAGNSAYSTASSFTVTYRYGYPAFGSAAKSNGGGTTTVQFLFDESSGGIVDEVASVTLAASGSPTYSVAASTNFAGRTPGITIPVGAAFRKNSATSEFGVGTSDFVIEYTFNNTSNVNGKYLLRSYHPTTGFNGFRIIHQNLSELINFAIAPPSPTAEVSINFTTPAGKMWDGNDHKVRIVCDRSANAELFFDEVSQGTSSISAIETENIGCDNSVTIGAYAPGDSPFLGTIFSFRIVTGTLTANEN